MTDPVLSARSLAVDLRQPGLRARTVRILQDIDLDIRPGETLGLVGGSGSGKTTLGRAILGSVPIASGELKLAREDISHRSRSDRRRLARDIQVVFQDPYGSLNPVMRVGDILTEPLRVQGTSQSEARSAVRTLLDLVRLPSDAADRRAAEFSGGQRQRIAIARALSVRPRLIVCDEAVSALDMRTQLSIMQLLQRTQEQTGVAYLFISHDLAAVRRISHRVAVMFQGRIVETADTAQIMSAPSQPYTQALLDASPVPDPVRQAQRRQQRRDRQRLPGEPRKPLDDKLTEPALSELGSNVSTKGKGNG